MPIELIAYGLLMAGLGAAVARFCPELAGYAYGIVLLAVVLGFCLGMLGLSGRYYRKFAFMSLLGITLLTAALNVTSWQKLETASSASRLAVLNSGLMFFFSLGLLMKHKSKQANPKVGRT